MALALQRVQIERVYQAIGSAVVSANPGSMATSTSNVATTVTVQGAAIGDAVIVSCQAALGAIILQGEVTAANTVTLKFHNCSGGAVTPGGGAANYNVLVLQAVPDIFV